MQSLQSTANFIELTSNVFEKTGVCYERYFVHNKTTYIPLKF